MLRYIARRLFMMVPLLIGISIISFAVIHLAPGNPVEVAARMNPRVSAEALANLRKLYGLDKPLYIQYAQWVGRLARFDFGKSFTDGRPVVDKLLERLPVTLTINALEIVVAFLIAVPLGIMSAIKRNTLPDKVTTVTVFLGFSMPGFWFALLLMILFGVQLGWLPISGLRSLDSESWGFFARLADYLRHIVLIVFIGAFGSLAGYSRYMRSSMLEVIGQDYIRTARAKGLKERDIIFRHGLRNALMPIITIMGLSVPSIIGGSVILESIFAIPGMGQLFWQAVIARDYPLIMGDLVFVSFLTLLGNMLADVAYALADPRVRVG